MKKKMNLATEIDLTQDSVVQLTCWCGQIALHELWGLGRVRLDRITRREQQLKMVGDRAATMAWQLMALACVQELGFGAALPLSGDEVRRKIEAAKAQMDTGAYRRRG